MEYVFHSLLILTGSYQTGQVRTTYHNGCLQAGISIRCWRCLTQSRETAHCCYRKRAHPINNQCSWLVRQVLIRIQLPLTRTQGYVIWRTHGKRPPLGKWQLNWTWWLHWCISNVCRLLQSVSIFRNWPFFNTALWTCSPHRTWHLTLIPSRSIC